MFSFSRVLKHRKLIKYSTQVAVKDTKTELQKTVEKITKVTSKEIVKKPRREPYVKNFFLGVCDTELLGYPEVLDKKQVEQLENDLIPVKDFFESVNRNDENEINRNYIENLNNLKVLGLQVPSLDGGRQLCLTETFRFYEEFAKADGKIGIVENQQLGLQMLLKYNKPHFKTFIGDIINGKSLTAVCLNETTLSDNLHNKTEATLSSDGKYWILNGTKRWIVNGDNADLFIVITQAKEFTQKGLHENKVIALLVRRSDGVTSKPCDLIGLNQTDIADVSFINTPIPIENVIMEEDPQDKKIRSIISEYRLSTGPIISGILRKVINKFIDDCIKCRLPQGNVTETEIIQIKIGKLVGSLYAIESLTYLTAGLIDQYEDQDCEIESTITKVFSMEHCCNSILEIMKFFGTSSLEKNDFYHRLYNDSMGHLFLHESVNNLKIIIALLGLQFAGRNINDKIKVLRNPAFFPIEAFKRVFTQRQHFDDEPDLTLKLNEYLHPSLKIPSLHLEYTLVRIKFATEVMLGRYGNDVIGKHSDLERLGDAVIDSYAIAAVLARANRSYCIGLQHATMEMEIATAFVELAVRRVKDKINTIVKGRIYSQDDKHMSIGNYSITNKQYTSVSPISRIF